MWQAEGKIIALDVPLQWTLKRYAEGGDESLRYMGVALGAAQYNIWTEAIKSGGLVRSNALWDALSTSLSMVMGPVLFNEQLDATEWTAVALMVSGIGLLAYRDYNK